MKKSIAILLSSFSFVSALALQSALADNATDNVTMMAAHLSPGTYQGTMMDQHMKNHPCQIEVSYPTGVAELASVCASSGNDRICFNLKASDTQFDVNAYHPDYCYRSCTPEEQGHPTDYEFVLGVLSSGYDNTTKQGVTHHDDVVFSESPAHDSRNVTVSHYGLRDDGQDYYSPGEPHTIECDNIVGK